MTNLQLMAKNSVIYIPGAFTPNDDATNEEFTVEATCLVSVDFRIYNRWDQEIFHTNKFPAKWNGEIADGTIAAEGIYAYRLIATGIDGTKYDLIGKLIIMK